MNSNVRVRFAPSPTGPLHIGGLRTALFNYLFARKQRGKFVLRIEDTDRTRYVKGAEEYILKSLEWCGLVPDEGPGQGGGFGPYRQSERKDLYREYAMELIQKGHAYYAFDTTGDLEQYRKECEARGETFVYDAATRMKMRNSLTLKEGQVNELLDSDIPYVIRFRFDHNREIPMNDLIRGELTVNSSTLDDKVLFKSDGMPTYHLANVVDDNLMAISHVIRGEEWLPSLPLHVSLYRAFGWDHLMPAFAHLPLILKPSGKGKLSKRDGEKGGFPVYPLEWKDPDSGERSPGYREEGYLPAACINLMALLGWNPGTEQELFSMDELVEEFQLDKVGRSGSRFDPEKSKWFNHQHIQMISDEKLAPHFQEVIESNGASCSGSHLLTLVRIIKPRITFYHEIWDECWFFFEAPLSYDPEVVRKKWREETPDMMRTLKEALEGCEPFTGENVEILVKELIADRQWGMGAVMNAWRLLLVGTARGPGLFDLAGFLGRDEVARRMETGIETIEQ